MPDAMVTNKVSGLVASIHEDLSVQSSSDVPVTLEQVTPSLDNLSRHKAGLSAYLKPLSRQYTKSLSPQTYMYCIRIGLSVMLKTRSTRSCGRN